MKIINIEQVKELIEKSPEHLISLLGDDLIFDDGENIKMIKIDKLLIDKVKSDKMFIISHSNMHTIVALKK